MHVNHRGAGSAARRRNSEVVRRSVVDPAAGLNLERRSGSHGLAGVGAANERPSSSVINVLTSLEQRRASYPTEASRGAQKTAPDGRLRVWHVHLHGGARNRCFLPKGERRNEIRSGEADQAAVTRKSPAASGPRMVDDMGNNLEATAHKRVKMEDGSAHTPDTQGPASIIQRSVISSDVCPADAIDQSTSVECLSASGNSDAAPRVDKEKAAAEGPDGSLLRCKKCGQKLDGGAKILPCFHVLCSPCFELLRKGQSLQCNVCQAEVDVEAAVHFSTFENQSSDARKCVICENRASYFCENCEDNLCERCSQAHLLVKYTKDHVVRGVESLQKTEVCGPHNTSVTTFCLSCKVSLCERCVSDGHAEHETESMSTFITKVKQDMLYVHQRAKDLHDELGKAIQKVTQQQRAWEDHKCWLLTLLSTFFHRVQEMMLDREVSTVEKLKGDMSKESDALQRRRWQYETLDSRAQLIASLSRVASLQNDPKPLLCSQKLFNKFIMVLGEQIPTRVPEVKPYALSLPFKEIKELLDRLDQSVRRESADMNAG